MGRDRSRERRSSTYDDRHKSSRYSKERKISKRGRQDRSRERSKKSKRKLDGKRKKYKRNHRRRKVRFVREDEKLFDVKFFRRFDEPTADPLTESQIFEMKDHLVRETLYGTQHLPPMANSAQRSIQDRRDEKKLNMMTESIPWTKPKRANRGSQDKRVFGNESDEKIVHANRISSKIACFYSREYQIPDNPTKNSLSRGVVDPNHEVIEIEFLEFVELSKTGQEMEEEEPLFGVDKKIKEFNRDQLKKIPKRSIVRKNSRVEDSESDYTESEDDIDEDEEITAIAKTVGVLGINIRNQKGFMTSVKKEIINMKEDDRLKVKECISWMKIFYDGITHVETTNANKMATGSSQHSQPKLINFLNNSSTPSSRPSFPSHHHGGLNPNLNNHPKKHKKFNPKRKTVPCRWFHGPKGCQRGENCDYIHDERYRGREVPNMNNYVRPIHQLSKNPENNLMNMMIFQEGQGMGGNPQPAQPSGYQMNGMQQQANRGGHPPQQYGNGNRFGHTNFGSGGREHHMRGNSQPQHQQHKQNNYGYQRNNWSQKSQYNQQNFRNNQTGGGMGMMRSRNQQGGFSQTPQRNMGYGGYNSSQSPGMNQFRNPMRTGNPNPRNSYNQRIVQPPPPPMAGNGMNQSRGYPPNPNHQS